MKNLEKAEIVARESAAVMDKASKVSLAAAAIVVVCEVARKHPQKAAVLGIAGLVAAAELKTASVLFEKTTDAIGIKIEAKEDESL